MKRVVAIVTVVLPVAAGLSTAAHQLETDDLIVQKLIFIIASIRVYLRATGKYRPQQLNSLQLLTSLEGGCEDSIEEDESESDDGKNLCASA